LWGFGAGWGEKIGGEGGGPVFLFCGGGEGGVFSGGVERVDFWVFLTAGLVFFLVFFGLFYSCQSVAFRHPIIRSECRCIVLRVDSFLPAAVCAFSFIFFLQVQSLFTPVSRIFFFFEVSRAAFRKVHYPRHLSPVAFH